jgi:hypothetical protein
MFGALTANSTIRIRTHDPDRLHNPQAELDPKMPFSRDPFLAEKPDDKKNNKLWFTDNAEKNTKPRRTINKSTP